MSHHNFKSVQTDLISRDRDGNVNIVLPESRVMIKFDLPSTVSYINIK